MESVAHHAVPERGFSIQELMDASPAIISLIDTDRWDVLFQNNRGRDLLGEITGKTCYTNIPKQPERCGFCRAKEALETGRTTSSEVPLPDGKWLLVQWAPIRSHDNQMQVVETITDVTETKQREQEYRKLKEQFEHLATLDSLTGLLNRRGWLEKAERVCRRAAHDALPVEVLMADVDHFKRINDRWGHATGDRVLRTVAGLFQEQCRPGDVIGRWGGEEFIVLLSPPVHDVKASAERVRQHVACCPVPLEGETETVTMAISIGGAATVPLRGDLPELEELIRIADQRLYQAKAKGRNQVCVA